MKQFYHSLIAMLIAGSSSLSFSQTVAGFENFTLTPNSFYKDTGSTPYQTTNAIFEHHWNKQFSFWSGGFSYTNKYDSATAGFNNLYGVRAYKGNNASAMYSVGQDYAMIKLKAPFTTLKGLYVTNTTYAYKAMRNGDSFARKFGDTTGTGSGTTIAQGSYPDYFKLTAKAYLNGQLKSDSAVFYLADLRFSNNAQDYILDSWQYFNTSSLGQVDSVYFRLFSSDNGNFGMNTPAFFAIDDVETAGGTVGVAGTAKETFKIFPNPASDVLNLVLREAAGIHVEILDINMRVVADMQVNGSATIDISSLPAGVYILRMSEEEGVSLRQFIKSAN